MTIYSWTPRKRGWCGVWPRPTALKWGGDETYAEVLFELLAYSPTFLAATGLRLRRSLLCVNDVRLDFQTLERGRCYMTGFRHPNFHRWSPTWLTWGLGSPRRLAFKASRVKQLTIVKISFLWSVVKTLDVVVYGWKTLSSYRGEPLTMKWLPSPASPCLGSWPAASGSSIPHLTTFYPSLSQARSLSRRLVCIATPPSCPPAHLQSPPATTSPVGAVLV